MYEKDKKQRITLRLNEKQFDFIASQCVLLGITPSDYLRMLVNATMFGVKNSKLETPASAVIKRELEDLGRENDEAHIDD